MKVIYNGNNATLYRNKSHVVKELKKAEITFNWTELYKEFSKDKPYYIQVNEYITPTQYSIEYIDVLCDTEKFLEKKKFNPSKEKVLEILQTYFQIYTDCLEFSKTLEQGQYWMHTDLHLHNLIITKDHQIKLVDADAFMIVDTPIPFKYVGGVSELFLLAQDRFNHV